MANLEPLIEFLDDPVLRHTHELQLPNLSRTTLVSKEPGVALLAACETRAILIVVPEGVVSN